MTTKELMEAAAKDLTIFLPVCRQERTVLFRAYCPKYPYHHLKPLTLLSFQSLHLILVLE